MGNAVAPGLVVLDGGGERAKVGEAGVQPGRIGEVREHGLVGGGKAFAVFGLGEVAMGALGAPHEAKVLAELRHEGVVRVDARIDLGDTGAQADAFSIFIT